MSEADSQNQVPPVINAAPVIPFNLATHPLDGDIDLSTTNGYKAFKTAQEVDENEKRLSISVSNSTEFYLRVKHKVDQCRLHSYLMFGTAGTGVPTVTAARTRGQPDDVNLNEMTNLRNLLTNHTALTLSECQAVAQYNWGDNRQTRVHGPDLELHAIDPTDLINGVPEAYELKRLSRKQQYRIRAEMMTNILQGIVEKGDWKLLIDNDEAKFTFIAADGTQKVDGFLVLKVILDDIKPEIVVEVRHLEDLLQSLDLKKCNNNVLELTRKMESTWREINKQNPGSYGEDRFIRELFRALMSTTNQDFKSALSALKRDHTLRRNNVTYSKIITEANTVYKTMTGDGEWSAMSDADKKLIALSTKIVEAERTIKALLSEKDTRNAGGKNGGKGGDSNKNPTDDSGKDTAWEKEKAWRCKKKGASLKKDGKEWVWCQHHMDGKGMYMPKGHDHDKWKAEKADKKKAFAEKRREKREKSGTPTTSLNSEATGKLNLAKHLTEALTTQVGLSDGDTAKLVQDILEKSGKA